MQPYIEKVIPMQFISQNVALIEYDDISNNSISFPDAYDISFTVNENLISPSVSFHDNMQTVYFNNISRNDTIHAFFHNPIKGIKGKNILQISPLLMSPFFSSHLFSNNYQPRINNPEQNTELNNLSKEDNTFIKMFTGNHVSMERIEDNNVFYPSFIPRKTPGNFQIVIKNFNKPIQLQFLFYDQSNNLIEKINSSVIEPYIENPEDEITLSSSSSEDSSSSEIPIEYWTSTVEINQSLQDKFLRLGRIENDNGITFNELKWKCRYSIYREGNFILWRDYSPVIIFKINEPPAAPANVNVM